MTWLFGWMSRVRKRWASDDRFDYAALVRDVAVCTERERVARELHDGVCQMLLATKHSFERALESDAIANATGARHLVRGLEQLEDVLGEIRRVSHNLKPAVLDEFEFVDALEQLGKDFTERTRIEASIGPSSRTLNEDLSPSVRAALYRVAQEALTNVEKHAAASRVELRLEERSGHVALAISDDGRGVDRLRDGTAARKGIGLSNMHERLMEVGGTLVLRSAAEGTGTEVVARVPLPASAPDRGVDRAR